MECKLWCCRVLSLVCTMRVDIRLSKLLKQYKGEYDRGAWAHGGGEKKKKGLFGFSLGGGNSAKVATKDGYTQLTDEGAADARALDLRSSGSGKL
eukprot:2103442-Prymnesium_polylepis.1